LQKKHGKSLYHNLQSNNQTMTKEEVKEMRTKILQGIELSYNRLLSSKKKENGELVISKNGKIIEVKAKDLRKSHKFIPS
jgi:hypothetical protein